MKLEEIGKMNFKPTWREGLYTIYSLINVDNGKRYIGRTKDLKQRLYRHYQGIKNHFHSNKGIAADSDCKFEFEILEENIPFKERKDKEKYWILHFKTSDSRYGYNLNDPLFAKGGPGRKRKGEQCQK